MYLKIGDPIPAGSKLSGKMQWFIDEYMVDMNALRAIKVAYRVSDANAPKQAERIMNHPLVAAEIAKRVKERQVKTELTADFLVNKLIEIIGRTEEDNPTAALRAIELAGKSIALWKERQEISGPDGKAIEMEQRTKEAADEFTNKLKQLSQTGNVVAIGRK